MNTGRILGASSDSAKGWLVTGGRTDSGQVLSSTEVFANGTWTAGPELPKSLCKHCQVQAGDVVIVTGDTQR